MKLLVKGKANLGQIFFSRSQATIYFMPRKKKSGAAAWTDSDDAPELTDEFFDRAEIHKVEKNVRRGRPPLPNPKQAVKLRLDADVLAAYRNTGRGWQTRINADLRKARKLKAG
jgi:uncharacterized protein (DUF4415 family)